MSHPVLDLTSSARWQLAYTVRKMGDPAPGNGWYQINPFYASVIFTSHTLVFSAESETARAHWWLGCKVQQIIDVPNTAFEEIPASYRSIPINRLILIRFPQLHSQYRLRFEVPYWHKDINITVWEYAGTESDSTEDLIISSSQSIETSLDRIETKIDNLDS